MKIHFVLFVLGIATFQLINANDFRFDSASLSIEDESGEVTKCGKNEYYSVISSRCMECGKCGSNMYEKVKCHRDIDTVCDWCLADNPIRNDAFFHECEEYIQVFGKFRKELKAELQLIREESGSAFNKGFWLLVAPLFAITIIFIVVSFWMRKRQYTRVINVTPPQLSELDDHNIIFAANYIREKDANKRGESVPYEYL